MAIYCGISFASVMLLGFFLLIVAVTTCPGDPLEPILKETALTEGLNVIVSGRDGTLPLASVDAQLNARKFGGE
jgi:hypothetical protein